MADDAHCPHCGHETPRTAFCVRCGFALDASESGKAGRARAGDYAAAPGEPVTSVRIGSTLFPQLPQEAGETFRWLLLISAAATVAPAALGFFPVALIVAALAIPLLLAIYLYAVDVYEDEPVRVYVATAAWGIVAGVVTALIGHAIAAPNPVAGGALTANIVGRGIVVPLLGGLLAAVGPLYLLRYEKFNDVLDGTTFGAVAGAWFVGAQAIATAVDLIGTGIRPPGNVLEWIARLLALGVVSPILWAATLGSLMGAIWLRYRAPVNDRAALGWSGSPTAVAVAAGLVLVLAAIGQILLGVFGGLVWLALLSTLPLVLLRRSIHRGLLQEATEGPIGDSIRCANCGRATPRHTCCGHCGVALRATPKTARRRAGVDASTTAGET